MQIPVEEEGLQTRQGHRGLEKEPPTPRVRGQPRHPDVGNQKGLLASASLVLTPSMNDCP